MSVENSSVSDVVVVSTDKTNEPQPSVAETQPQAETAKPAEAVESETTEEKEEPQESEEQEGDSEEESADEGDSEKKKPSRAKRRYDKVAKRASEAEERAAYWERMARQNQQPPAAEAPKNAPQNSGDQPPAIENFETYAEYIDALTDWKIENREKAREAKATEAKSQADFEKAQELFTSRAKAFAADKPDWSERVQNIQGLPFNQELAKVIHGAENGPELLYHLMGDEDVFERVNALEGAALYRELGRIEERLETSKAAPKPTIQKSKAPPPVSPVSTKAPASVQKSPEDMDPDEYMEWRRKNSGRR